MRKALIYLSIITLSVSDISCLRQNKGPARIPVARAGEKILYYDQIPEIYRNTKSPEDSIVSINDYINSWARRELLYARAVENLSPEYKNDIESQLLDTKINLYIYHYQHQMMLEKMDTIVSDSEIEQFYASNPDRFKLNTSIVKALFIKIPAEAPNIDRVRVWYRANDSESLRQLESYCFQFAEKFDDFGEEWISFDKLAVELPAEIINPDEFLKRYSYYETRDSSSVYFIAIRDYRLRSSLAPYEYVKDDIKSIILNNRRFEFLKKLENDIYNDAINSNIFKKY
ncbi:MAG TPA: hypothetical protein P5320_04390 [Bacteroidales bacterium]|nr:hypothetical protein [Bacteroidales bacterium]HOK75742.1 hypothetical protein [Bacteroidales bacterium]HOM40767.1 hypothetical protein [Bacteroidales bacterium]HPP92476.1 hypothetical protein [Bacteroidales bacterium]HQG56257.1 hypothetical protein [Bacteroidales bacterium]